MSTFVNHGKPLVFSKSLAECTPANALPSVSMKSWNAFIAAGLSATCGLPLKTRPVGLQEKIKAYSLKPPGTKCGRSFVSTSAVQPLVASAAPRSLTICWHSSMESCGNSSAVLMMSTLNGPLLPLPPFDSLPPVLEPATGALPPVSVVLPPTPVPPIGSEPEPAAGVDPLPAVGAPPEPPLGKGISLPE